MSGLLDRINAWLASLLGARAPTRDVGRRGRRVVLLVLALLVLPSIPPPMPLKSASNASALTWPGCRASLASCGQRGPQMPPRNHWSLSWIKPPGLPDLLPRFAIHSRAALVVSDTARVCAVRRDRGGVADLAQRHGLIVESATPWIVPRASGVVNASLIMRKGA